MKYRTVNNYIGWHTSKAKARSASLVIRVVLAGRGSMRPASRVQRPSCILYIIHTYITRGLVQLLLTCDASVQPHVVGALGLPRP